MQAPYAADTRAKGWRLEIDHERIRQSDTWALASSELRPWLLMLWMVAWEQTPCGSLPADDALIAARIGMSPKVFAKNREVLMRGWVEADDGRLYHKVLSERVTEMLARRLKDRARTAKLRAASSNGVTRDTSATHNGIQRESHVSSTPEPDTSNQRKEKEPPKPTAAVAACPGDDAGLTPRQRGTNPRALGTNPRAMTATKARSVEKFDAFWSAYPKKTAKAAALKAWLRAEPDDATVELILRSIAAQSKSPQWVKDGGAFIPHPATWLNGRRWEDEIERSSNPDRRPGQIAGAVVDWSATEDA